MTTVFMVRRMSTSYLTDFFLKDFLWTDDNIVRIITEGVRRLMIELDKTLSKMIPIDHMSLLLSSIINNKAQELSNYLTDKRKTMDLSTLFSCIDLVDNAEMRKKILGLSYYNWYKMGYSKGTLHYMKKNARPNKPFTLNQHVKSRLNTL